MVTNCDHQTIPRACGRLNVFPGPFCLTNKRINSCIYNYITLPFPSEIEIDWSKTKSKRLKKIRGLSFSEILRTKFVSVQKHPLRENQSLLLFEIRGYLWVVPFVRSGNRIFLKTLYPSRCWTKKYRRGEL